MDYSNQKNKTIILEDKGKISQFLIENIVYFECEQYISTVHLFNTKETKSFCKQLKIIEKELAEYEFLRVNRNALVNMKYADNAVSSNKKRCLIVNNSIEIQVSRRKWHDLKNFLKN